MRATYPGTLANSLEQSGPACGTRGTHRPKPSDTFKKRYNLVPTILIALNNLGSAYRQQKQWDDARTTYERALALSPNDADANYGIGMVYAQNDDTARAFESLQRALKLVPFILRR